MSRPMLRPEPGPHSPPARTGQDPSLVADLARSLWASTIASPAAERIGAMEALATLAVSRAGRPGDLAAVCADPTLFPCWRPDHPLHAVMRRADSCDPSFAAALRIARRAMAVMGATGGADGPTRFHGDDESPAWALGLSPVRIVGGLLFYRA